VCSGFRTRSCAGEESDALHFQNRLQPGHSPVPARRAGFWYGLLGLLLLAAPSLVSGYVLSQLQFICIYSIVGLGLMLLTGYTGQISLGHAAFLAVGAYTEALLQAPACRSSSR
jgi:ABC-type branched-subunit amino acid transport system permease subunit